MKDLNFFDNYIKRTRFKMDKSVLYGFISAFFVVFFTFYIISNSILIKQESDLISKLKLTAENPKKIERIKNIKKMENEVNKFGESIEKIRILNETIEDRNIINEQILKTITSKIPEDLFFTSLNLQKGQIQIVGISKDKLAIAELGKGLESLEKLEEIFISNISLEDEAYNFTIDIELEGADLDEEELYEESMNQIEEECEEIDKKDEKKRDD